MTDQEKQCVRSIVQACAELTVSANRRPCLESRNLDHAIEQMLAALDAWRKVAGRS
jgi:hypothetical protein